MEHAFKRLTQGGVQGSMQPQLYPKATAASRRLCKSLLKTGVLIELWSLVGVSAATNFVFTRRQSTEPICSSDCLCGFAKECGATQLPNDDGDRPDPQVVTQPRPPPGTDNTANRCNIAAQAEGVGWTNFHSPGDQPAAFLGATCPALSE